MVDSGKSKKNEKIKVTRNSCLPEIDIMSLLIGAALYSFFPVLAYRQGIDALIAFAAAGPLWIGYTAKTDIKAILLGIVGGTPLMYLAYGGYLGTYMATETADLVTAIIVLGLSGIVSWFGAHLYQSSAKAKSQYETETSGSTKNVQPKRKLEDTGSVKQNIINMFKPRK